MGQYLIWKDGTTIENGIIRNNENIKELDVKYAKKRLKQLNGNTLHIINGDVIDVHHNKNNRVVFSHTFTREEK